MAPSSAKRRSVIIGVVVLLAVVAVVALLAFGSLGGTPEPDEAPGAAHPSIETSQACTSCKAPLHDYTHRTPFTGSCESCHSLNSWRDVRYTHVKQEFNVSLHSVIGCTACHTEGEPNPSPACETCHKEKSPHGVGAIPCGSCHTAIAWVMPKGVPSGHVSLEGGHEPLSCFDCHSSVRAADAADRRCVDCHGRNHGGLTACEDCHEPSRGWEPLPGFNHAAFFPLVGKHTQLECADCHVNNRFAGTPNSCRGCHAVVHTGLTACEQCHTPHGFVPSTFNHDAKFKITGKHRALTCAQCHIKGKYDGTPTQCSGCHGTRHGGLTACQQCHTTSGFVPSTFAHASVFKLEGAHAKLACSKCHPSNQYANNIGGGSTACGSCHSSPHGAAYSSCATCHTPTTWSSIKPITHPGYIRLGAAHSSRSCRLCHPTLRFGEAPKPCQDCHLGDVPHVGPTDCLRCHRPTVWSEVHFTHPELGIHEGLAVNSQCLTCHPGRDFTRVDCRGCHLAGEVSWPWPPVSATTVWLQAHARR
jgi:hypothetical protein